MAAFDWCKHRSQGVTKDTMKQKKLMNKSDEKEDMFFEVWFEL